PWSPTTISRSRRASAKSPHKASSPTSNRGPDMISLNHKTCWLALAAACAGFAGTAQADDNMPANSIHVGAYMVHFDSSAQDVSGPFTPAGINLSVDNVTTSYFAYIRHLDGHWSIELAGGTPPARSVLQWPSR